MHLFCKCYITDQLCNQLRLFFEGKFNFPPLTIESAWTDLDSTDIETTDLYSAYLTDNFSLLNNLLLSSMFTGVERKFMQ